MRDLDQARALLDLAARDLRALEGMSDATVFADEIFGFHMQQTAEKALKAWLATEGVVYPKTHDLSHLLSLLEEPGGHRYSLPRTDRVHRLRGAVALRWARS
jgi:HEPN domain-containing protein